MDCHRGWLFGAAWIVALVGQVDALQLRPVQTIFATTGLAEPSAVVASPDGRHVYAAGRANDAIVAFRRDRASGDLTAVQVLRNGIDGADGVRGVVGMTISDDGAFLYAAASGDDDIAVLEREPATGRLSIVQVLRDEPGASDAFTGAVVVSKDGRNVYATGFDSVSVFARDPVAGVINLIDRQRVSTATSQLEGTNAIAVSPDNRFVYVDSFDDGIVAFRRESASGKLARIGVTTDVPELQQITALAISPDGRSLFAAAYDTDALVVFDRDSATGALTTAQVLRDEPGALIGLDGAYSVAASGDGRHVLVAALDASSLVDFERDPLTARLTLGSRLVDGEDGVTGMAGSVAISIAPDDRDVYVAALFADTVAAARIEPNLTFLGAASAAAEAPEIADAEVLALSPDDRFLYTVSERDGTLVTFARDASSGRLSRLAALPSATRPGLAFSSLAFAADGSRLLVSSGGGSLDVFARDRETGLPTLLRRIEPPLGSDAAMALSFTTAIATSSDGLAVFATSAFNDAAGSFAFDPTTGDLVLNGLIHGPGATLDRPTAIVSSSDGAHVYILGSERGSIFTLTRDPASEALSVSQVLREGDDGISGLRDGKAMVLSPTEDALVVVASGAHGRDESVATLAVFDRDVATGGLAYRRTFRDQTERVEGLSGVRSIAASAAGGYFLTAAPDSNAIALFRRDPTTAVMTFDRALIDGSGGLDTLAGVTTIVVTQDSRFAYAIASRDHALSVFRLLADSEPACSADCDGDNEVIVAEIVRCVAATLGAPATTCQACDTDGSGDVDVTDLLRGISALLAGCTTSDSPLVLSPEP